MSLLSFSMHVTSEDSKTLYPDNKPWSFTVVPPYPLDFYGEWRCRVVALFSEIDTGFTQPLCVHAMLDCVKPCIAYGSQVRIVATMPLKTEGQNKLTVSYPISREGAKLDVETIHRIKVDLVNHTLREHCTKISKAVLVLNFEQM